MKVTLALTNDELYRTVRIRAAQNGRQIRDIVEEALEQWLERQEDAEDVVASREAVAEYESAGGVDADRYFQRMVAEGRIAYESD